MQTGKSWLREVGVGVLALALAGVAANAGVISAGYGDSFGVKADNSLWGWGYDGGAVSNYTDPTLTQSVDVARAQLGLGPTNGMVSMNGDYVVVSPTQSGTAKTWLDVVGGVNRGFGIQSDGSLWGWGYDGDPAANYLGYQYVDLYHFEQGGALGLGAQMGQVITGVYTNISVWTNYSGGASNDDTMDVYTTTTSYTNSVMNGLATNKPAQVGTGTLWRQVAAGGTFGLGLQADGSIWSWGSDGETLTYLYDTNGVSWTGTLCQAWGQLGQGDRVTSTHYSGGEINYQIAQHYTNDGAGNYTLVPSSTFTNISTNSVDVPNVVQYARTLNTPTRIAAPTPMVCVAAGYDFSAAIGSDGSLRTWGLNQGFYFVSCTDPYDPSSYSYATGSILGLGDTTLFATNVPARVGSETNWASVSAGMDAEFTLAIKKDGSLWGWGNNGATYTFDFVTSYVFRAYAYGTLGLGSHTLYANTPTRVGTDNNWAMVSAGGWHGLGLKSDGSLWAWGGDWNGQLGLGRGDDSVPVPTQVGADNDWVAISAGYDHSLALKSDGSLYAWGANYVAQLGDQEGTAYEPIKISDGWGLSAVEGDFDGDRLADPYVVANGGWTFWFSSGGYLPSGPYVMSVPGGVPVVGDFDGDGLADPAMVANGGWTFWFSSGGYLPSGPYVMSVPGGVPVVGDFDGDGLADPAMVANGNWTFWYSRGGYLPWGPYVMSVPGGKPVAGDFDGDRKADPAMVANGNWTFWFSSDVHHLPWGPYVMSVPGGVPVVGDFDGDGLADPTMVHNNNWTFWLSSGGHLPSGPYALAP